MTIVTSFSYAQNIGDAAAHSDIGEGDSEERDEHFDFSFGFGIEYAGAFAPLRRA